MAELAITTVNPTSSTGTKPVKVQVGEAVAEGDFGYKNGTKYYKCDNSTSDSAACTHIFLKAAGADEYTWVLPAESLDIGVTTVDGEIYCIASTAGQCEPHNDVASGEYVTTLFVGTGTSEVSFNPSPSGYAKP